MKEFREWHRPIVEWLLSDKCTEANPLRARDAYLHTTSKGNDIKRASVIFFLQYLADNDIINSRKQTGRGGYHGVYWKADGLEEYWAQSLESGLTSKNKERTIEAIKGIGKIYRKALNQSLEKVTNV